MNTKDYIENKKSKKLSNILKGALATGLVVGSMVTSTACKPNQPHESSSSTSKIETTTTNTTKIDEPIQISSWDKFMNMVNELEIKYDSKIIGLDISNLEYADGKREYSYGLLKINEFDQEEPVEKYLTTEDDFKYVMSVIAKNLGVDIPVGAGTSGTFEQLKPLLNEQALQIIMNTILEQESTNQSSQDDLVR